MMMRVRRIAAIATIALGLGLALWARPQTAAKAAGESAHRYEIKISDFSFQPAVLKVPAGSVVTWTNKDEEPHTVVSTDDAFKSRALDTDETFSFTFEKAGMYKYFCSVHPRMVGIIQVDGKDGAK
jgi:plastocyanin